MFHKSHTQIISSNAKYKFGLTEISLLLNNTFAFNIPEAVIKTSLKKLSFLKLDKGHYYVENISELTSISNIFTTKHTEIKNDNEVIISNLFKYIEKKNNKILSDDEKGNVIHAFCNFLLSDSISDEYAEYISAFIICNKNDVLFTKKLETIKEGVVLYSGIKYNSNINEFGSWNSELTIFLDMEMLFHFSGYNGEIYKQLFDDINFFVKKINIENRNKRSINLIHLKYFKDVKNRIEGFFEKATYIFEGSSTQDPSNTAMSFILDGCKSNSDIIAKKTNFFILLKSSGIQEDEFDNYFLPENHRYNIEDKVVFEKFSSLYEEKDITSNLKYLNYLNIHRKNKTNNNFDNIGYILLTGNSATLNIAWDESIKKNGCVPLATTLDFLTNKFWFRLSRGFGDNNYPKSFGIITKAQILLSSKLNKSVSKKFEELQDDYKKGNLTKQQIMSTIVALRKRARKPEDIDGSNMTFILESISKEGIEHLAKEQELIKAQASKQKDENIQLKECLISKENEIEDHRIKFKEIQDKLSLLEEKEKHRDENQKRRKIILLKFAYGLFLTFFICLGILLYKIDKKIIGSFISSLASILTILNFLGIDYRKFVKFYRNKVKKIS